MEKPKYYTEDVLGEFGFRLVWEYWPHWANVKAYEIVSRTMSDNSPYFLKKDFKQSEDQVKHEKYAHEYLSGYIKWDGCTELDQGCPHWCGWKDYEKHVDLLKYVWEKAFDLMEKPIPD